MTRSGRQRRISRVTSRRRSRVSSTSQSGYPRNWTRATPSVRAALRCSSARITARRSEVIERSLEPLLPLVAMTYVTSQPSLTSLAMVPPAPNSESSGCAVTTRTRSILSAKEGSFGAGALAAGFHCNGCLGGRFHRGWPDIDAAWLRHARSALDASAPLPGSTLWGAMLYLWRRLSSTLPLNALTSIPRIPIPRVRRPAIITRDVDRRPALGGGRWIARPPRRRHRFDGRAREPRRSPALGNESPLVVCRCRCTSCRHFARRGGPARALRNPERDDRLGGRGGDVAGGSRSRRGGCLCG